LAETVATIKAQGTLVNERLAAQLAVAERELARAKEEIEEVVAKANYQAEVIG